MDTQSCKSAKLVLPKVGFRFLCIISQNDFLVTHVVFVTTRGHYQYCRAPQLSQVEVKAKHNIMIRKFSLWNRPCCVLILVYVFHFDIIFQTSCAQGSNIFQFFFILPKFGVVHSISPIFATIPMMPCTRTMYRCTGTITVVFHVNTTSCLTCFMSSWLYGLSPVQCRAITWNNTVLIVIWILRNLVCYIKLPELFI